MNNVYFACVWVLCWDFIEKKNKKKNNFKMLIRSANMAKHWDVSQEAFCTNKAYIHVKTLLCFTVFRLLMHKKNRQNNFSF